VKVKAVSGEMSEIFQFPSLCSLLTPHAHLSLRFDNISNFSQGKTGFKTKIVCTMMRATPVSIFSSTSLCFIIVSLLFAIIFVIIISL